MAPNEAGGGGTSTRTGYLLWPLVIEAILTGKKGATTPHSPSTGESVLCCSAIMDGWCSGPTLHGSAPRRRLVILTSGDVTPSTGENVLRRLTIVARRSDSPLKRMF